MISTPFELLLEISNMPLISTDGSLIFAETSSIEEIIFFENFKSSRTVVPFCAMSINAS